MAGLMQHRRRTPARDHPIVTLVPACRAEICPWGSTWRYASTTAGCACWRRPRRPSREGQGGAAPEGQRPAAAVKFPRAGQQSYGPTVAPAGDRAPALAADPRARVARPPCGIPDTCGRDAQRRRGIRRHGRGSPIAGCLADPNALAAVGDRAAQAMSVLRPTSVEKLRPGEGARCASAESSPTRTAPLITRAL